MQRARRAMPMPVPPIATKCTWRGASLIASSLREGLAGISVVHDRPQLEAAALGHQVHAVREHHHDRLALQIDPQRSAREAEVADRGAREVLARRGRARASACPSRAPSPSPAAAAGASRNARSSSRGQLRRCGRARRRAIVCAKLITSSAVANRPACPATPPIADAFGSCTSPHTMRPRHGQFSVAATRRRTASGRAGTPSPCGTKNVSRMPSGPKMRSRAELVERPPRHGLDDRAEHDEVEVAIHRGRARLVHQAPSAAMRSSTNSRAAGVPMHPLARLPLALEQQLVEAAPRLQARRVREQVAQRHALLVALGERRQELRDRDRRARARPSLASSRISAGGGDRLGERREIEDRLARHRDPLGAQHREAARAEVLEALAVARHAREHDRARDLRLRDRLVERAIDARELALDDTPSHDATLTPRSSIRSSPRSRVELSAAAERPGKVRLHVAEGQTGDERDAERARSAPRPAAPRRARAALVDAAREIAEANAGEPGELARAAQLLEHAIDPVGPLAAVFEQQDRAARIDLPAACRCSPPPA